MTHPTKPEGLLKMVERLETIRGTKWMQMPVEDWGRLRGAVRAMREFMEEEYCFCSDDNGRLENPLQCRAHEFLACLDSPKENG